MILERFADKQHQLRRSPMLFLWGPIQTLVGFFLLYFATSLIFAFLNGVLGAAYFGHNNVTIGAVLLLAIAYFYVMALARVKEAHVGLPMLLGARRKGFVLPEGYSLILPWPIMGYIEVPIQPTTTELKDPMEIMVSTQPTANEAGEPPVVPGEKKDVPYQVRVKISMSIMWEPDPGKLLSYTAVAGGEEGVEKALVDVMRRTIREKAQHMSDTQVLTGQEQFEKQIWEELNKKLSDGSGLTFAERLGIRPIKVQTTKIVPSDEELSKRYERLRGEDLDQQAEKKQAAHIIENIALPFKNQLGVDGDVALHSALAITKDAKLNVVTGNAGDFTKGMVTGKEGGK